MYTCIYIYLPQSPPKCFQYAFLNTRVRINYRFWTTSRSPVPRSRFHVRDDRRRSWFPRSATVFFYPSVYFRFPRPVPVKTRMDRSRSDVGPRVSSGRNAAGKHTSSFDDVPGKTPPLGGSKRQARFDECAAARTGVAFPTADVRLTSGVTTVLHGHAVERPRAAETTVPHKNVSSVLWRFRIANDISRTNTLSYWTFRRQLSVYGVVFPSPRTERFNSPLSGFVTREQIATRASDMTRITRTLYHISIIVISIYVIVFFISA